MKKKKTTRDKDATRGSEDVVLIEDLTPHDDVRGGSGKLRFGQGSAPADRQPLRPRRGTGQSE